MKVSDYIMDFIASLGVREVFCVTGGGAMHMNNSLGQHPILKGVFMIHEQGASIAAESYARIKEGYGVCLVTSGPGGTNAVTGLVGAYIDSIPVIYISGQAKRADLVGNQGIRQFGIQEVEIISIVSSYSKYAVQIDEPGHIRYELEKAAAIAINGRPGPVWIDVPLDIQASDIIPDELDGFDPSSLDTYEVDNESVSRVIDEINKAHKPVLVVGHGIRLSHCVNQARRLYDHLGIPVLTSWNGVDLIEDDHPLYFGRPGAVGQRSANLIQQGADLVITIGTRLNLLSTGYNYDSFLSNSTHVMVDIDINEMNKKSVHPQVRIQADARSFVEKLLERSEEIRVRDIRPWMDHCIKLREKYPVIIPEQRPRDGFVSTYDLVSEVSDHMSSDDIFQFTSSGTSVDISMKVFRIKWGQRAFLTKGLAAMGYDVPASIGSCIASGRRRTVCITGDGSIAMNLQELEVIRRLGLPIKIFVVDNGGYSMIYQSQNGNFDGHLTGCTDETGLTLPDMNRIAEAFGIRSFHVDAMEDLASSVEETMSCNGPAICTVRTDITQKILPKQVNYMKPDGQMASRPIEDMAPLLERNELGQALNCENGL